MSEETQPKQTRARKPKKLQIVNRKSNQYVDPDGTVYLPNQIVIRETPVKPGSWLDCQIKAGLLECSEL